MTRLSSPDYLISTIPISEVKADVTSMNPTSLTTKNIDLVLTASVEVMQTTCRKTTINYVKQFP